VRGLRYRASAGVSEQRDLLIQTGISSFGYDEAYEVYAVGHGSGVLFKLVAH
jgi:hypothetical protein